MKRILSILMSILLTLTLIQPITVQAEIATPNTVEGRKQAADEAIAELVSGWDKNASQYDRIRTAYIWTCYNVKYDETVVSEIKGESDYIYYAVVEKRAVCSGYSKLFSAFLKELDIDSLTMSGHVYSNQYQGMAPHAWNLVKLGDYWYYCDPTWDAGRSAAFLYFLDVTLENHYLYGEFTTAEFWDVHPQTDKNFSKSHTCTYRTEYIDATCSEGSSEKEICRLCGEYTLTVTSDPLGHKIEKQAANPSSCIVQGNTEYFRCTRCEVPFSDENGDNAIEKDSWLLPFTDHSYGAYSETVAASCTKKGEEKRICSVCFDEETRELPILPHNPATVEGYKASCSATGLTDGEICSVCETVLTAQEEIPVLPHTPKAVIGYDSTCTETGLTDGEICAVCETVLTAQEMIPVKDHSYSEYTVSIPSSCSEEGKEVRSCSVCGTEDFRSISKLPHTPVIIPGRDSSCSATGLTMGRKCDVCDDIITPQTVIEKKEHAYGDYVIVTETSCKAEGLKKRACKVCGHEDFLTIEKLPHTEQVLKAQQPTCTTAGSTEGLMCSVCKETLIPVEIIPKNGHSYSAYTVTKAATCQETGSKKATCSVCKHVDVQVIAKLPHQTSQLIGTDSTCTIDGVTDGEICSVCDSIIWGVETIPAKGHLVDKYTVIAEPDCLNIGVESGFCNRCQKTVNRVIPEGDHTPVVIPAVAPTYTSTGLTAGEKCSVCEIILKEQTIIPMLEKEDDEKGEYGCQNGMISSDCPSKGFTDLKLESWYHLDADYVVRNGLMKGMSTTSFAPDTTTTRAMIVTILYRMSGDTVTPAMKQACKFADVPAGSWYADAVAWASYKGVVKGLSETSFAPDNPITREQMVTMLYRYADSLGHHFEVSKPISIFPDGSTVSNWAKVQMEWAIGSGLMNGTSIGGQTYLQPQGQTTRIQAAAFIHRLSGMLE